MCEFGIVSEIARSIGRSLVSRVAASARMIMTLGDDDASLISAIATPEKHAQRGRANGTHAVVYHSGY
jgi:hypothetical protein